MGAALKLFRRQSGQFQVVEKEALEILDCTRRVVEKLKSEPPPFLVESEPPPAADSDTPPPLDKLPPPSIKKLPWGTGSYSVVPKLPEKV